MAHWYSRDAQLIIDATLRDARKHGYRPGVTEVLKIRAQPGLAIWSENLFIEVAWELSTETHSDVIYPRTLSDYRTVVRARVAERKSEAPSAGSTIHGYLARMIRAYEHGAPISEWKKILGGDVDKKILLSVLDWYRTSEITALEIEESFSSDLGWAGTIDLYGNRNGRPVILDWKTIGTLNDDDDPKRVQFYSPWCEQLAAYAHGRGVSDAVLINVAISRDEPGRVEVRQWGTKEKEDAWRRWQLLFALWCEDKKYNPAGEQE